MCPFEDFYGRGRLFSGEREFRFLEPCGFRPGERSDSPSRGKEAELDPLRSGPAGFSSVCEDFIANEVKANHGGRWFAVKEVGGNGFLYIVSETFPVIGLGKYRFAQTFSDESAVGLLRHLEHDVVPGLRVCHSWRINKRCCCDFVKHYTLVKAAARQT